MGDEGIDCFALFGAFMAEEGKEKTKEENLEKMYLLFITIRKYHMLFSYFYFYSNNILTIRKYHIHLSYLYFYSNTIFLIKTDQYHI